ncbi:hypothetical protein GCM10009665_59030 [Kitasatospora nipponensis]|uniref:Uncharacterized protein n=1 Tax=Kitasatospora nipponensis TaxID=258049 RepID=A0ABP4HHW7_9ACTN
MDHGFGAGWEGLVAADQAAVVHEPAHCPPRGNLPDRRPDDPRLNLRVRRRMSPLDEPLTRSDAISGPAIESAHPSPMSMARRFFGSRLQGDLALRGVLWA